MFFTKQIHRVALFFALAVSLPFVSNAREVADTAGTAQPESFSTENTPERKPVLNICPMHPGADSSAVNLKIVRPVNSVFTLNIGGASILDTYLTPIRYSGINLRLGYERFQAMKFSPEKWIMQMGFGVSYANVQNIVGNRTMHSLMVDFSWGMMHRWNLPGNFSLFAGGSTSFDGGVIYNQYNSNNPVSPKIRWNIAPTGMAAYSFRIKNTPVILRYQATVPVISIFFSPDYGEPLYEVWLGNTAGLVNCGSWANRFDMTNSLSADFRFGGTVLRIGYRNTIESSWVHNINTQIYTHSFTVGVGGEIINLRADSGLSETCRIISAVY